MRNAYYKRHVLRTSDNWLLMRDNPNITSILNFPIQGTGAACLRAALICCVEHGLKVVSPLHDAIYFEAFETKLEDTIEQIKYCMAKGIEQALDKNHKIAIDISIHRHDELWIEKKGYQNFEAVSQYCKFNDNQLTNALEKINKAKQAIKPATTAANLQ